MEVARQARRASPATPVALDMLRDAAAKAQKKAEDKIYLRDAEAKIDRRRRRWRRGRSSSSRTTR